MSTPSTKTVATKKTDSKKAVMKKTVEKSAPAPPKVEPTPAVVALVEDADEKKVRVRRVVTRESLSDDFEALQKKIEDEIEKLRGSSEKVKGVKFLRTLNKSIKVLRSDSLRVSKNRPKTGKTRSTNSGFMKPVKISPEMAEFTKWDVNVPHSRVDVTKHICAYIREKELQNPADRRQILVDAKLKTLLKYDPANPPKDEKTGLVVPLTYFRLQQYIQPHFVKCEEVVSSA